MTGRDPRESPWIGDYRDRAEAYERARPAYPAVLLDRLVARVDVNPGDRVAEIGSGTGIFTRGIAERGFEITGIDPDPAMRAQAPQLAGVTWRAGSFESLGLDDASQHWVVAAQSFQRADRQRALPEIRRVLVPGGHFSVIHYTHPHASNAVVAETAAMLRRHVPEYHNPDRASRLRRAASMRFSSHPRLAQRAVQRAAAAIGRPDLGGAGGALVSTGDFECARYDEAEQQLRFDCDGYLALWSSRSRLATIAGARFEAFLKELERHLIDAEIDLIETPCIYGAWTARIASHRSR
jgi:SAM-dependent methyltransferase